jgi:hypothetical protein
VTSSKPSLKKVERGLYSRGPTTFIAGMMVDGRWTLRTLRAKTRTDARQEFATLRHERGQGKVVSSSKTTMDELAKIYLTAVEGRGACSCPVRRRPTPLIGVT